MSSKQSLHHCATRSALPLFPCVHLFPVVSAGSPVCVAVSAQLPSVVHGNINIGYAGYLLCHPHKGVMTHRLSTAALCSLPDSLPS